MICVMPITHFDPQNLGANGVSSEFQQVMHFQPAYPTRMLFTIDSTEKGKMLKEDGLNKLVALEQRWRAFEGIRLYDHVKDAEMCLVLNVVIPKSLEC
jgi:hypothetical protein